MDKQRLMLKILCASVSLWLIFLSACSELEKPKTEPFYAQTAPPQKKEFRWSNGKMPKSFDPARASAPPETVEVKDLTVLWTKNDARGLPAVVGDQLLMPVDGGLAVFTAANGNPGFVPAAIPVDRGGYPGRVDATAVGDMVIETRSDQVVGLTAS